MLRSSSNYIFVNLLLIYLLPAVGCAQNIKPHPRCEQPAFDLKLEKLLNFSVNAISCRDLNRNLKMYYILDARERSEFDVSHLPNARYIGYSSFDFLSINDIPKSAAIVVYCSVGYRSEKIGEKLIGAGYSNVNNLYGSIFEWVNEGYPVFDNLNKPVKKVHAYNADWGKWVTAKGYLKIY
ncbi:MAG: rhodanese-like domain-containing protein [Saprospiraceae bacterium]